MTRFCKVRKISLTIQPTHPVVNISIVENGEYICVTVIYSILIFNLNPKNEVVAKKRITVPCIYTILRQNFTPNK